MHKIANAFRQQSGLPVHAFHAAIRSNIRRRLPLITTRFIVRHQVSAAPRFNQSGIATADEANRVRINGNRLTFGIIAHSSTASSEGA